ncbi:MAG: hypothetical protein ACLR4A_15980 [Christensenellales bacterium]
MAKLEAYDKTLDYSYAPGIFPATECLKMQKALHAAAGLLKRLAERRRAGA